MYDYQEGEAKARVVCEQLNIKTKAEWKKAWDKGKISKRFPQEPWRYYTPSGAKRRSKNAKI